MRLNPNLLWTHEGSRELWKRTVQMAKGQNDKVSAADFLLQQASVEIGFGNASRGRELIDATLSLFVERARMGAAQLLAEIGEVGRAGKLVDTFSKDHPTDTMIQSGYVPMVRAQIWDALRLLAGATAAC